MATDKGGRPSAGDEKAASSGWWKALRPTTRKRKAKKTSVKAVSKMKPGVKTARKDTAVKAAPPHGGNPQPAKKKASPWAGFFKLFSAQPPHDEAPQYGPGERLYRCLYYTGIQVLRMFLRYRRRAKTLHKGFSAHLAYLRASYKLKLQRYFAELGRSFYAPYLDVKRQYKSFAHRISLARRVSLWHAVKVVFLSIGRLLKSGRRVLGIFFNYIAPVVGLLILFNTIGYVQTLNFALAVEYNGDHIGYIKNESVFFSAQENMMERIINEEYVRPDNTIPRFSLAVVDEDQLTDVDTLANRLISASGNVLETAEGIYIGDKFMGATTNGDYLLLYLDSVLDQYRTGASNETITFIQKVQVKKGLYPVTSISNMVDILNNINGDSDMSKIYTVKPGDTPTGIASDNGVTYASLKALNPDIEKSLMPGQQVLISKSSPNLGVKLTRTETYDEDVPFGTESTPDNRYYEGYTAVTKAGVKGVQEVVADVTYIDGVEVERNILSTKLVKEPIPQKVIVGTQRPLITLPGGGGNPNGFLWPVDGGYVSAGIYSYRGHTGMDIATRGVIGVPVRASKAGRVVISRYYGAYGNHVMINHGDGVQTLYAHMNSRSVAVGQYVEQGQLIGTVGRTGNVVGATGVHLHFEVRVGGRYMDPSKYVGTYYPGR